MGLTKNEQESNPGRVNGLAGENRSRFRER